jgi:hypothetical protein
MGHIFRSQLHACETSGRLVFLDVVADRYFALGATASAASSRLVAGHPAASGDSAIVEDLVARGILLRTSGDDRPGLCRPVPDVRTCVRDEMLRARPSSVFAAFARHALAVIELKARPLHNVLASVARDKGGRSNPKRRRADPAELAAAFAGADRMMTALGRCLPRSIALARAMNAGGIAPDLILGVKLRPFEAHCWVQHGECLVSDDRGAIGPFTPILII